MRSNKTIFWISFFAGVISIGLIVLFHFLGWKFSEHQEIYTAVENVFISLVGGAFLSAVTSAVGFLTTKRQYETNFASLYIEITNLIKDFGNWYVWDRKDIKYLEKKDIDKYEKENPDCDSLKYKLDSDKENDKIIKRFANILESIKNFNYDEFYKITDDYCSFWFWKKQNKVFNKMTSMITAVRKYDILTTEQNYGFGLYQSGVYPAYHLYKYILPIYSNLYNKEATIKDICKLEGEFLELTKLNYRLSKVYKTNKKSKEEAK